MDDPLFERFAAAIGDFDGDARSPRLRLGGQGSLSCHYAPLDWRDPAARVLVVDTTPGEALAAQALETARRQLAGGASIGQARAAAGRDGTLPQAIRVRLVAMLDAIGLHHWLGVSGCDKAFLPASRLVQVTSILPYPIDVDGADYTGAPDVVRTPFLRERVLQDFLPLAAAAPNTVLLPIGPAPARALEWLVDDGHLAPARVLSGLPHAADSNPERVGYFTGDKARHQLSARTDPAQLDAARRRLLAQVAALPH